MAHWKLTLSYNGSAFHGWQVQPGLVTVQGTLASALNFVTGETVLPQGSGRTDAGVHALAQIASFELSAPIPVENLQRALNHALPSSLRILAAELVPPGFHARHCALRKTYEYRLFERRIPSVAGDRPSERICSPFLAPFVWDCRWQLELERMQHAAAKLLGTHDFTSLAAVDPDRSERGAATPSHRTPIKTIYASAWRRESDLLIYTVCASGFLHHMVRNIVGTLVEVGRGTLAVTDIDRVLALRDRSAAGPTAPACGLFLINVEYGHSKFVPVSAPSQPEPPA